MSERELPDAPAVETADARTRRAVLPDADRITLPSGSPAKRPTAPDVRLPPSGGLVRSRLVASLDRLLDVRVCAVVAPPGSGKTTALAHWARQAPVDVLWWRASPGTDPVSDVLAGLGAALRPSGARLPQVPELADVGAALDRHHGPVAVILDDFHHVAVDRVGALLERLLLATGDHVHLVIGSRVLPPLNLARSEVASHVVGPSDLRFRPVEVAELFRVEYRIPISAEDARALARNTEGWAAALHLFHHGVAGRGPHARHRALAGLGDGASYARDYLARTFLADLATPDLAFLRQTAPFEALVGGFCDRLLGRTGSEETIARLVRRGVLTPVEDGRGFALPRVLRAHLLTATTVDAGPRTTELAFRAAADILGDAIGSTVPSTAPAAARAWAAGGSWPEALTVLAGSWDDVLADPDLSWLDAAPPDVLDHPLVRTARAECERRDGRLQAARDLVAGPPPGSSAPASTAAQIERFGRTWTIGDLQPEDRWNEYLRVAVRRPDPDRRTALPREHRSVLAAMELTIGGNLAAARRQLRRSADLITDPVLACAADLLAAALHPDQPDRADAVALQAEDLGFPWLARLAHGLAHADDADLLAAEANAADDRDDVWGALLLAACGAVADLRAQRPASRSFDDVARRCRELDAPALESWARSGQALSSVLSHLPDAVREAESAVGFAFSAQVPGALAVARLALAICRDDSELRALAETELDRLGLRPPAGDPPDPVRTSAAPFVVGRPPLEVRCFGGFDILVDGAVPDLGGVRPRARALLRLLALHAGHPAHREVIAEAMWPRLDGAAALHNLHVCVSGLRTALEPGVARGASRLVVRDGDRYLLALPDGSVSDLRTFDDRTAAAESAYAAGDAEHAIADLEAALDLYVGEVLPEDGPTEWVLPHREHYQGRAAEAAAQLGRLHLEHRRPDEAAAAARRSIDIDPFRDASWRLLIAAHHAAGNLAGAEEARRSYADVLASLGVASHAATRATDSAR